MIARVVKKKAKKPTMSTRKEIPSIEEMLAIQPVSSEDKWRPIDRVIEDHATMCWGVMRHVSPLDSERAIGLLTQVLQRLLQSIKTEAPDSVVKAEKLRAHGGRLARAIKVLVAGAANSNNPALDNRNRCRECDEPTSRHSPLCRYGQMIREAGELGMITLDEV